MTPPTLDQILALAHQLPREQRRQLITRLEQELTTERPLPHSPMTSEEARVVLGEVRRAVAALPPPRRTAGEQLDADRRARDDALLGRHAETDDDVHA